MTDEQIQQIEKRLRDEQFAKLTPNQQALMLAKEEARSAFREAEEKADELRIAYHQACDAFAASVSPFKVGDIISWKIGYRNEITRKGRIDQVRDGRWHVRVIRKDGKEGKRTTVSQYSKPTLVTAAQ